MSKVSKDIVAALEAAVAAVDKANVPKDLRVAAFNAAFYGGPFVAHDATERPSQAARVEAEQGTAQNGVELIADKLEVGDAQAAVVYDVDEDGVHLTVKRAALNKTKKFAQQEVAYLLAAGRQAAGIEEWTPTSVLIGATHDRGVHDSNVSKAITALDGDGFRFRKAGGKREAKLNAVGFSKASEVVKRITEPS